MAYTTAAKVVALSNSRLSVSDIQSDWLTWNASEIDSLLNVTDDFFNSVTSEVLYIITEPYSKELILRSPIVSVTSIKEDDNEMLGSTSSTATTLTVNTNYHLTPTGIYRMEQQYWQKYVEVSYSWGYSSTPRDIELLSTMMLLDFALGTKQDSTKAQESIGSYSYQTTKNESTSHFGDQIGRNLKALRTKYSPPIIATTQMISSRKVIT
tara:strand:- start:5974 stop:6603 length:630 start_codon:yes stop_codon:yes gene_type:complete